MDDCVKLSKLIIEWRWLWMYVIMVYNLQFKHSYLCHMT